MGKRVRKWERGLLDDDPTRAETRVQTGGVGVFVGECGVIRGKNGGMREKRWRLSCLVTGRGRRIGCLVSVCRRM
jgi:hypothetical protein